MYMIGDPFRGQELEKLKAFLPKGGLSYEENIQWTVNLLDRYGEIIATGSLEDNIIKCVLVSSEYRGQNILAELITLLVKEGIRRGHRHLLLFTRPSNSRIFQNVGFYEVARTEEVVLMENIKDGIRCHRSLFSAYRPRHQAHVSCLICRDEDNGSKALRLIKEASTLADVLRVLVLRKDCSSLAYKLIIKETKHIGNVLVSPAGIYLEVFRSYPVYFLPDKKKAIKVYTELFLKLFYVNYALPMGLKSFFVGSEQHLPLPVDRKMLLEYMTARHIEVISI
mgnify:CR=1 FL=1